MGVAPMPIRNVEPVASIETITPAMAKTMLDRNDVNRNVRPTKVLLYARDLLDGKFQLTGEAIKFDTHGNLIDGQHRLHAVLRSGEPLTSFVVRGVHPSVQLVLDSGAARTTADALHLNGYRNATIIASAARLALAWTHADHPVRPGSLRSTAFSTTEVVAFIDDQQGIIEAARFADNVRKTHVGISASGLAAAIWVLWRVSPSDAERFFDGITNASLGGPSDPRLALIRRMNHARNARQKLTAATQFGLIVRTWNAWRTGQKMVNLPTHKTFDGKSVEVIIPRPR